ncbi:MAG: hypothetical protein MJZ26_08950 [Fibrobacter sp.]|nr:hypothetical protein [Fibrobacter sp.]
MKDFEKDIEQMMKDRGMPSIDDSVSIKIEKADEILYRAALWYFGRVGKEFKPIPEYRQIANWLEDNQGKGLLLFGNHGRGKTILAKYMIPAILLYFSHPAYICNYYKSTALAKKLDEALTKKVIVIDDMGVESQAVEYGNRRNIMDEVMDTVEQDGKLIIITTNLDKQGIIDRYGQGVYDRIIQTTKRVAFKGGSFRGRETHRKDEKTQQKRKETAKNGQK